MVDVVHLCCLVCNGIRSFLWIVRGTRPIDHCPPTKEGNKILILQGWTVSVLGREWYFLICTVYSSHILFSTRNLYFCPHGNMERVSWPVGEMKMLFVVVDTLTNDNNNGHSKLTTRFRCCSQGRFRFDRGLTAAHHMLDQTGYRFMCMQLK